MIKMGRVVVEYLGYLLEFLWNFATYFEGPNERLKSGQIPGRDYI